MPAPAPYPLLLRPILFDKVWGGDRLARFGKHVAPGARVGESWELADLASTSPSGAGGAPARSVIDNGPLAGRTLHDAMTLWGPDLLGAPRPGAPAPAAFPLLTKFLDARENLSVQVHPSPDYAAAHPGSQLKTECWYILEAQPGAVIYKGIKAGVTPALFRAHVADGTVVGDLVAVPAVPGECHDLPSGTCHALGAGVLVAEVQTPSDTTFRVFDWGRAGRALHVEEALACLRFPSPPPPPVTRAAHGQGAARLVMNQFFTVDEHRLRAGASLAFPVGACCAVVVVAGDGRLHGAGAAADAPHLSRGSTALLPARVADRCSLLAQADVTALLVRLP